MAAITDSKIDYSTLTLGGAERVVGYFGTEPIYEKFISGTGSLAASTFNIAHGVSPLVTMISLVVQVDIGSTGTNWIIMPHVEASQRIALSFNGTNVTLGSSFAWGAFSYRVLMRYTKT